MQQKDTIVLAGGTELTSKENIHMLESAGFLVITANTLDYALAASELFKPKMLVIDSDQIDGDVEDVYSALGSRQQNLHVYVGKIPNMSDLLKSVNNIGIMNEKSTGKRV